MYDSDISKISILSMKTLINIKYTHKYTYIENHFVFYP